MISPQPLTKENGHCCSEGMSRTDAEVWLAAQWLKEQLCRCGLSKCRTCIYVDEAFGACRPDTEKKQ